MKYILVALAIIAYVALVAWLFAGATPYSSPFYR